MLTSTTIHTAHGYSITVRRVGLEIDLETRNAAGETISTVRMSEREASRLLEELDDVEAGSGLYSRGYDDGYSDGRNAE